MLLGGTFGQHGSLACVGVDASFVPTPLSKHREPDLSFVLNTMESVLLSLHRGMVLSLESTTYPGTTDEELKPRIESRGFSIGEDIFLVFSPEREDPGNKNYSTQTIPKVCGGCTPRCLEAGIALYGHVVDKVVPVSSTRAAELTKLLENIHRSVNIGLVNEMKIVADKMGIDLHEVFVPRPPSRRICPLLSSPESAATASPLIRLPDLKLASTASPASSSSRRNQLSVPIRCFKSYRWIKYEEGQSTAADHVLGIAYKKNVDDSESFRHSHGALQARRTIPYSDLISRRSRPCGRIIFLASVTLTPETIATLIVCCSQPARRSTITISSHARLLVDCRGKLEPAPNIIRA